MSGEDPHLAAWRVWAATMTDRGDVRGPVLTPLLDQGFDAFNTALGRPDVAPLVKTLLLELGPLPPWVRPAALETVEQAPLDLLRASLVHLITRALPPAAAGLTLDTQVDPDLPVEQAQAASIAIGTLARTALERRGGGPLETAARLLDGALGHYIRFRVGAPPAAHEAMALAAASARALEALTPGARLALVQATLPTWAPWDELMPAVEAPAVEAPLLPAADLDDPQPPPESDPPPPRTGWLKSLIAKVFSRG